MSADSSQSQRFVLRWMIEIGIHDLGLNLRITHRYGREIYHPETTTTWSNDLLCTTSLRAVDRRGRLEKRSILNENLVQSIPLDLV